MRGFQTQNINPNKLDDMYRVELYNDKKVFFGGCKEHLPSIKHVDDELILSLEHARKKKK